MARTGRFMRKQKAACFFVLLWIAFLGAAKPLGLAEFIDQQLVSPVEFRFRRLVGKEPVLSPKLKILAYDDIAMEKLGEPYLPHELWSPLLRGISGARPAAILCSVQFAFEKKNLAANIIQDIGALGALSTPHMAGAILVDGPLVHRKSLLTGRSWRQVEHVDELPVYAMGHRQAYGPEGPFRLAFPEVGHADQPWSDRFAPLVRMKGGGIIPHLGLYAASRWETRKGTLFLDGNEIPLDDRGLIPVNFLNPEEVGQKIKTVVSLFSKINAGDLSQEITEGDVVLIIGAFGTGASPFMASPFGPLSAFHHMIAITNSVITGNWVRQYDVSFLLIAVFGVVGFWLGWCITQKLFFPAMAILCLASIALDLVFFVAFSARIPVIFPMLAVAGGGVVALSARIRDEQRRRVVLEMERQTAAALQKDFLPNPLFWSGSFNLAAYYQAAEAVGGDWYSYHLVENRWFFMHVGDVTGHGTPAALCASFAKGAIDALHRTMKMRPGEDPALDLVHLRLNDILVREGSDRLLLTLVSVAIDLETGDLWYLNSAHPAALIISKTQGRTQALRAGGTPILGFGADFPGAFAKKAKLEPGDYVLLYTDGLTPLMKPYLRWHDLSKNANTLVLQSAGSAEALRDHFTSRLQERKYSPLIKNDDITLVVFQYQEKSVTAKVAAS